MAEVYEKRILKFLQHADYQPIKLSQMAKALGVSSNAYPQFKAAFDELRSAGHVIIGSGNLITLPSAASRITGTFRSNPKGFGFISTTEPTSHGDLFVPPGDTADAMTGDIVSAKVVKRGTRRGQVRLVARVIEILERAQDRFVGTLFKEDEGWFVQPDGSAFVEPISVDDVSAKNARAKDKVVVEILAYPTERYLARGVIIEVLGKSGRYDSEILSVIRQFHLPTEFDSEYLDQAHKAATSFDPGVLKKREDITGKTIVTIDPPDAKDFDDAISLEKDAEGNFILGVHIADVSQFIPEGSPLDEEAKSRGNSVYLPAKTIPMLPEVLSNGVCSLQPDQPRFAKSAYITYDPKGRVKKRRFANSLIKSTQRLTYQQANRILKGHTKGASKPVINLLKDMETLSRAIEGRRRTEGMLHLDLPETELIMDDAGRVVDAEPADTSYPHTIIEMFMVEANEAVASLIDRLNIPFLRRIHPEPDALTLKNLSQLIRTLGYSLPRTPDRRSIQDLLAAVKGTDVSLAVNIAVLRSFERAQYAPQSIGHYALASTHYCHFTSPIRRYADLTVHRVLQFYIEGKAEHAKKVAAASDLAETGRHITFAEQRAQDAERELKAVLILQMLADRIGEELHCVVTGLTNFGVFVQSQKFGIEGLIRSEDLGPDDWQYEEKRQCLVGQKSGAVIRLGQPMNVSITKVNVPGRQLDVVPVEPIVTGEEVRRGAAGRHRGRGRKAARRRRTEVMPGKVARKSRGNNKRGKKGRGNRRKPRKK